MLPTYEISLEAEKDWINIVQYTLDNFGENQVQKYTKSLLKCLDDLSANKAPIKEMKVSSYTVLVKPCQKHYIFALKRIKKQTLLIIAVLHEQMDLIKRLKLRLDN